MEGPNMSQTSDSPAMRAMEEAIELAIAGRSPYPDRASFVNEGTPITARRIKDAFESGRAVVLVSADGSTRVLQPEPA
jgi:hypothetical protein